MTQLHALVYVSTATHSLWSEPLRLGHLGRQN